MQELRAPELVQFVGKPTGAFERPVPIRVFKPPVLVGRHTKRVFALPLPPRLVAQTSKAFYTDPGLKKKAAELLHTNEQLTGIVQEMNSKMEDLERISVQTGKDNIREKEQLIKDLHAELDSIKAQLEAENKAMQEKLVTQTEIKGHEMATLRAELKATSDQMVQLVTRQSDERTRQEVQSRQDELNQNQQTISDLKDRIAAGEQNLGEQIAKREQQYMRDKAALETELAVLAERLSGADREHAAQLRSERDRAEARIQPQVAGLERRLGAAEGQVAGQAQLVSGQKQQIAELKRQISEAQTGAMEDVAAQDNVNRLQELLRGEQKELATITAQLQTAEQKISFEAGKASVPNAELVRLEGERNNLRREVTRLQQASAGGDLGAQEQVKDIQSQLQGKDREITEARAQGEQTGVLRGERSERQKANRELADQRETLTAQINKLQQTATSKHQELLKEMERKLHEQVRARQEYEAKSTSELAQFKQTAEQEKLRATTAASEKGKLTVSLSESQKALIEKQQAWHKERGQLVIKQSAVDSINVQLQSKLDIQSKEHTQRINAAKKIADSGRDEAVKLALQSAESRHLVAKTTFEGQIKTKDKAIAGYQNNLDAVQKDIQRLSKNEIAREQAHSKQLAEYHDQFQKAQKHMYAQVDQIKALQVQLTQLAATGRIGDLKLRASMQTAVDKENQLRQTIASSQEAMDRLKRQAAAQVESEVAKVHKQFSAANANMQAWHHKQMKEQQEKHRLLEQDSQLQARESKELADLTARMHGMAEHIVHNPDPDVMQKIRAIAGTFQNQPIFQQLLAKAQSAFDQHEEKQPPQQIQLPPGYTAIPDAMADVPELERLGTKRKLVDIEPEEAVSPAALRTKRSVGRIC